MRLALELARPGLNRSRMAKRCSHTASSATASSCIQLTFEDLLLRRSRQGFMVPLQPGCKGLQHRRVPSTEFNMDSGSKRLYRLRPNSKVCFFSDACKTLCVVCIGLPCGGPVATGCAPASEDGSRRRQSASIDCVSSAPGKGSLVSVCRLALCNCALQEARSNAQLAR